VRDVVVRGDGIARTYGRGETAVVALHGASFEVSLGEGVSVLGPSGSGKSTLLHVMAGLDAPSSGRITWPALEPAGPRPAGTTGFIFQGPSLLVDLDVAENVALPLLLQGRSTSSARRSALAMLQRVGIADVAARLPAELSGGQEQRAAVARALVSGPRLVLADEPTGQLDRESAALVVDVLATAVTDGAAVVVATHDRAVADRLGRAWTITDGRLRSESESCSA